MHRSQVPVRSACGQRWDEMQGGARRRFCDACQRDVTNLSALTEKEAGALLGRAGEERVCVRYESDREGRILFRAEPRETPPARTGLFAAGALAAWTRTAVPLIPVSALIPACAAAPVDASGLRAAGAPASAPEAPALHAPCDLPSTSQTNDLDLTLGDAGAVVVVVRDQITRRTIEDAVVTVRSATSKVEQTAVTGKDGKVAFGRLAPADDYFVRFDADAYRSHAIALHVSAGWVETLEVGLVPGESTIVGEIIVPPRPPSPPGSASQGVKLDQTFITRVPLR